MASGPGERGGVADDAVRLAGVVRAGRRQRMRRAERRHPRAPCRARVRRDEREQGAQRGSHVGDEAEGGLLDLAQLARVDVDVQDPRARAELRRLAGGAVVEADAEADQQVALLEHEIRGARGVHADHAEEERVLVGQHAETEQGGGDRDAGALGEPAKRGRSAGADDAGADQEDRPLGRVHQRGCARDVRAVDRRRRVRPAGLREAGELDGLRLHVLRHVDDDRSWPSRGRDAKRVGNHLEQLAGASCQVVVLRDRDGESVGVDLLERVGPDHAARHLAGDGDERDRVELRVGDAGQQVGRAGAGRPEAHGGTAGRARHALGDECGALLVTRQHVADPAGPQRVVEGEARAPGDSRGDGDALPFEQPHDQLGAGGLHPVLLLRVGLRAKERGPRKDETPAGLAPAGVSERSVQLPVRARWPRTRPLR